MLKKILVMGLPGSGKTTLAKALCQKISAVHFNADEVRSNLNRDLGFSIEHRIEHARRMGWLCDLVCRAGHWAVADFVCPTQATRQAFGPAFVIWMHTIQKGRFEDTNQLFESPQPEQYHLKLTTFDAEAHASFVVDMLSNQTLSNMFEVN